MTLVTWGGTLGPPPGSWLPANPFTTLTTDRRQRQRHQPQRRGDLNHARWFSSGVLLPDGQGPGGRRRRQGRRHRPRDGASPSRSRSCTTRPPTQWTEVAAHTRDRAYHNSALLLPDMRVLLGGNAPLAAHYGGANRDQGGPFANNDKDPSFEIWSPPYLFRGARPTVTRVQKGVGYGETFTITTPDAGLDRVGRAPADAVAGARATTPTSGRSGWSSPAAATTTLTATAPPSGNVAPPGTYYLVVNKKSLQGPIPSVARMVDVGRTDLSDALAAVPRRRPGPVGRLGRPPDEDSSAAPVRRCTASRRGCPARSLTGRDRRRCHASRGPVHRRAGRRRRSRRGPRPALPGAAGRSPRRGRAGPADLRDDVPDRAGHHGRCRLLGQLPVPRQQHDGRSRSRSWPTPASRSCEIGPDGVRGQLRLADVLQLQRSRRPRHRFPRRPSRGPTSRRSGASWPGRRAGAGTTTGSTRRSSTSRPRSSEAKQAGGPRPLEGPAPVRRPARRTPGPVRVPPVRRVLRHGPEVAEGHRPTGVHDPGRRRASVVPAVFVENVSPDPGRRAGQGGRAVRPHRGPAGVPRSTSRARPGPRSSRRRARTRPTKPTPTPSRSGSRWRRQPALERGSSSGRRRRRATRRQAVIERGKAVTVQELVDPLPDRRPPPAPSTGSPSSCRSPHCRRGPGGDSDPGDDDGGSDLPAIPRRGPGRRRPGCRDLVGNVEGPQPPGRCEGRRGSRGRREPDGAPHAAGGPGRPRRVLGQGSRAPAVVQEVGHRLRLDAARRSTGSAAPRPTWPTTASTTTWPPAGPATPPSSASTSSASAGPTPTASCSGRSSGSPPPCGGSGIGKGDRVTVYMPTTPEAIILMLATVRIGAIHSVVFAGFGAGALGDRIRMSGSKAVFAADFTWRKGKTGRPEGHRRQRALRRGPRRREGRGAQPRATTARWRRGATSPGTSSWPAAPGRARPMSPWRPTNRPSSWPRRGRRRRRSWPSTSTAATRSASTRAAGGSWTSPPTTCGGRPPTSAGSSATATSSTRRCWPGRPRSPSRARSTIPAPRPSTRSSRTTSSPASSRRRPRPGC